LDAGDFRKEIINTNGFARANGVNPIYMHKEREI